jgi:hypothetical protein
MTGRLECDSSRPRPGHESGSSSRLATTSSAARMILWVTATSLSHRRQSGSPQPEWFPS